jgi:serine/threonine-protein kinase
MAQAQQQQRYRVIERIAAGGMAEVYRAESAGLEGFKKTVAIKRVLPHLSKKKEFIGMFLDEARLSAHLNHSNCVQVFDIGAGDDTYFIVMEYVDGSDLKAVLEHLAHREQRIDLAQALYICCRICDGLAYAHEARDNRGRLLGIVHRDISPPNVLMTRHGEVKVVDFGLAKANSQLEQSQPGIIKGKFSYLSPEAASGHKVDMRADLFAAGIILWEMLAGRRLFLGETDLQTVKQVQAAQIPDIKKFNPNIPPEVERILAKALAQDPNQRYQSAREMGLDLNQVLYSLAKPVSAFDIAALVSESVKERDRKKARQRQSIIGTLIEDAMMEFTSLDPNKRHKSFRTLHSTTSSLASQPLDALTGSGQEWGGSLGLGGQSVADTTMSNFSAGNLAALDDADALPDIARATAPPPSASAIPPAPAVPGSAPRGSAPRTSSAPPALLLASSRPPPSSTAPSAPSAPPPSVPRASAPSNAPSAPQASAPQASAPQASAPHTSAPPAAPRAPQPSVSQGVTSLTPPQSSRLSTSTLAIVVVLVLLASAAGAFLSGAVN